MLQAKEFLDLCNLGSLSQLVSSSIPGLLVLAGIEPLSLKRGSHSCQPYQPNFERAGKSKLVGGGGLY